MGYFKILGLEKEPFSTSPDPDFFYLSKEHDQALTNVLIELHLRRGLSVILGDVGTGKTTLSRKLIQCLTERGDFILNIILDPYFKSERLFLASLLQNFDRDLDHICDRSQLGQMNVLELKQVLQKYLYEKCIIGNKTVVVIIDEAQKVSRASLEMLRVVLNYETNESKLLQLVLLGQLELHAKITSMSNFLDRISFRYTLNPFGVTETRDMIRYRLEQAGYQGGDNLFLDSAVEAIHEVTRGYPRRINLICHRALKAVVMRNQWAVDEGIIRDLVEEDMRSGWLTPILR